ncbi:hypothetical protein Lal_00013419 [Lupinus albus]|nr:hypothetical protein Lal_00013419 [Lupinus albus]
MIMDDLFSLRGYISNRMDALDAQNLQVQIEFNAHNSKSKGSILKSCKISQRGDCEEDLAHDIDMILMNR